MFAFRFQFADGDSGFSIEILKTEIQDTVFLIDLKSYLQHIQIILQKNHNLINHFKSGRPKLLFSKQETSFPHF